MSSQMYAAHHLFAAGHAQQGETLEAMVERMFQSGVPVYSAQGQRLNFLTLSAQTNYRHVQIALTAEQFNGSNKIEARGFSNYTGPAVIRAEELTCTCRVCSAKKALPLKGSNGKDLVYCLACGSSDFADADFESRGGEDLLQAIQASNVTLSFTR